MKFQAFVEELIEQLNSGAFDDELRDKTPKERELELEAYLNGKILSSCGHIEINNIPEGVLDAVKRATDIHFSKQR